MEYFDLKHLNVSQIIYFVRAKYIIRFYIICIWPACVELQYDVSIVSIGLLFPSQFCHDVERKLQ